MGSSHIAQVMLRSRPVSRPGSCRLQGKGQRYFSRDGRDSLVTTTTLARSSPDHRCPPIYFTSASTAFCVPTQDLGGREWTVDGSGELLILNPPSGDALPGTVVNTSYAFRDLEKTNDPAQVENERGEGGRLGGGVTTAGKRGATAVSSSSHAGRETSSASLRG